MSLSLERRSASASFGTSDKLCSQAAIVFSSSNDTSGRGNNGGSVRIQGLQACRRRTETGEASQGGMNMKAML